MRSARFRMSQQLDRAGELRARTDLGYAFGAPRGIDVSPARPPKVPINEARPAGSEQGARNDEEQVFSYGEFTG